ncbi:MAG: ComF family protein [Anaerovorax sp.]
MFSRVLLETVGEFLYPSNIYCISCGNLIDKTRPYSLCDRCLKTFHWATKKTCIRCGKILRMGYEQDICPDCITVNHKFQRGYCCVEYGEDERAMIHRFKYREEAYLGKKMAEAMYDRIQPEDLPVDLIVPVPMYKRKQKIRGYNQAEILGKNLAKFMEKPYNERALVRIRETEPMSTLGAEERVKNVRHAFRVDSKPGRTQEKDIAGKVILLVDDIYTTGSTMDSCAEALLKAGAQGVFAYAFAAGK